MIYHSFLIYEIERVDKVIDKLALKTVELIPQYNFLQPVIFSLINLNENSQIFKIYRAI